MICPGSVLDNGDDVGAGSENGNCDLGPFCRMGVQRSMRGWVEGNGGVGWWVLIETKQVSLGAGGQHSSWTSEGVSVPRETGSHDLNR